MKFSKTIQNFKDYLITERGHSELTAENYSNDIKQFINFHNSSDAEYESYSAKEINEFLNYVNQNNASSTRNRKMYSIKKYYSYLEDKDKILTSPATGLEKVKERSNKKPVYMDEHELKQFFKAVDGDDSRSPKRNKAIVYLMTFSGLRVSEVCSLDLDNIDFSNGVIDVEKGKGNKDRVVPLHDKAKEYLVDYINNERGTCYKKDKEPVFLSNRGNAVSKRTVQRLVKAYVNQANINKRITPHKLRHTFSTLFYKKTKDIKALQEILGHSDLATTQIYTHVDGKKKKKQVNSLSF
jgi:integrase/recombinase XerC